MFSKPPKQAGEIEYRNLEGGKSVVRPILQCCHCGVHWEVIQGSGRQRGWCQKCFAPICGQQKCMCECKPYQEQLEQIRRNS